MKKWIVPIAIIVLLGLWSMNINNKAVELEANAKTEWADVESAYQRRSDLYSSVVQTVKSSADFERKVLNEVIEARSKATSVNIDVSNLTPDKLEAFQKAQGQLKGSFSRLIATFERYPDLKTTQQFRDFQAQQEGTENRINVARDRYNDAVNAYDIFTTKFPNKILTGLFGFEEMYRFKADEGADKVPNVEIKLD